MLVNNEVKCENCVFFDCFTDNSVMGLCKRETPVLVGRKRQEDIDEELRKERSDKYPTFSHVSEYEFQHPEVYSGDFCSQFTPQKYDMPEGYEGRMNFILNADGFVFVPEETPKGE